MAMLAECNEGEEQQNRKEQMPHKILLSRATRKRAAKRRQTQINADCVYLLICGYGFQSGGASGQSLSG
jgi:hypothetical protein